MKNLFLLSFLVLSHFSFAQNMILAPGDTVEEFVTTTDYYDIFSQHIYAINPGANANFKWELINVVSEPLPSKVNLCDPNQCYPIPPGNIFEFPIPQNDSADMKAEVLPRCQSGTYVLRVRVYSVAPGPVNEKFLTYISHVTAACPTQIQEVSPSAALLSQNPFAHQVQVSFRSAEVKKYKVFDVQGRVVADEWIANQQPVLIGGNWGAGTYVLHLSDQNGQLLETMQLIKQ